MGLSTLLWPRAGLGVDLTQWSYAEDSPVGAEPRPLGIEWAFIDQFAGSAELEFKLRRRRDSEHSVRLRERHLLFRKLALILFW